MASKYIMLECNRLRANLNYKNIDEAQDIYKNEWVNNVNSYGIVCNPGDVITCESSAINTVGASDSTIEFLGEENKNGFIDNRCKIKYAYYLNDTGVNNVKLPLAEGEGSAGMLPPPGPEQKQFSSDGPAPEIEQDQYVNRNRMLGEYFLDPTTSYNPNNPIAPGQYINPANLPQNELVMQYSLSKESADIGNGYVIGNKYSTTVAPAGGTGMIFKVLEITNEGATNGIPSKIQMIASGTNYNQGDKITLDTNISPGGTAPAKKQVVNLNSFLNKFFNTKQLQGPTGKRYYFAKTNWTGPYQINFDGAPTNLPGLNFNFISPDFEPRTSSIDYEVPQGLNTPDNMGAILTEQMHKGTILRPNSKAEFIKYGEFLINSQDINDNPITIRPPLVETPSYKPMPANGQCEVELNTALPKSFAGCRQIYYNKVGYLDPNKLEGLGWLNQVYYGTTNSIPENQINTGSNQVANIGDFLVQEIGNLGLFTALMCELPRTNDDKFIVYPKNGIILTNLYFTGANLQKLANGFKKCEQYFGDQTLPFQADPPTDELGVNLDVGRYATSQSAGYPAQFNSKGHVASGNRQRFKTPIEKFGNRGGAYTPTPAYIWVDNGNTSDATDLCTGNIPFRPYIYDDKLIGNDGLQLPQLVVKSRFDESLYYDALTDNPQPQDPDNLTIYQQLFNIINVVGDDNFFKYEGQINDLFINQYTEAVGGETFNTDDLIALAKKFDIAAIPIFPKKEDGDPFNEHGGRPYIGLFSFFELGKSDNILSNITFEDPSQNKYRIDARNMPYGIQLGYDPSPIRNPQVLFYNTNYGDPNNLNIPQKAFNPVAFMGAVNPNIDFNPDLSRFELKGLNTPMTIGNGLPTNNQFDLDATGNPEQQCFNCNVYGQIASLSSYQGYNTNNGADVFPPLQIQQLNEFVGQTSDSLIESFSGLAILAVSLFTKNGDVIDIQANGLFSGNYNVVFGLDDTPVPWPDDILDNTLFGKMGFQIEQLLPKFGSIYAYFEDPIIFLRNDAIEFSSYEEKFLQNTKPMTTGAIINSAEYQPTSTNSQDMPLYGLGTNIGLPSRPAVDQGAITAQDLPSKLDYPYLLIYSSIIQGGTDTEYYGGLDGKSKLPCVGYITRNYNQGDFFYSLEQSFNYTCTKSFSLTEIKTEIRLPDGSRPRLQPHNSVIYKITKPMVIPQPLPPPQTTPAKRGKQGDGKSNKGP